MSGQDAILTFRHSLSEQIDLDFRRSENIGTNTILVTPKALYYALFMPKTSPLYRWRICSGCMGYVVISRTTLHPWRFHRISSSHTPSRKERLPEINHREVVKRALHIYQLGMISKVCLSALVICASPLTCTNFRKSILWSFRVIWYQIT